MSFEGEIGEIDLIQRLVELAGEQFTGAIRFESDGIIKIVYFKGGDVLSASTNDRSDAIDEILLRAGKVTREHVKQALAKRKESETLGDALLGLGFITRKELTWARRVQVIGILRSILGWKTGSYTIVADYLPKREEGTLFPLPQIIVELTVTDNDRGRAEQAMDSGNAVFRKSEGFDDAFRRLGLNEDAEQIVAQIDGANTAADVAARSEKDVFNVYKLLEALRLLKLLNRADKPEGTPEVSSPAGWAIENPDFTLDDIAPTVPLSNVQEWAVNSESQTMEIPAMKAPEPKIDSNAPPIPATRPVWDDPADTDETVVDRTVAVPSVEHEEPQWGFDEAQIEAARRAAENEAPVAEPRTSAQVPAAAPKSNRSLLIPLLLLLVLAGAGYAGWVWWQGHHAVTTQPGPSVRHQSPRLRPAVTATTTTAAVLTSSATNVAGSSIASTQTAGSPASGAIISPTPTLIPTKAPLTATVPPVRTQTAASQVAASTTSAASSRTPKAPATRSITPPRTTTSAIPAAHAATKAPATAPALVAAQTPKVVPPSPVAPTPANDAARAKYDAMAARFAADPVGSYTLQFELVCETASVTRARATAGDKVWFLPTSYRGRPCYRVFWGRFDTREAAKSAVGQFPSALGSEPVVVKIPR